MGERAETEGKHEEKYPKQNNGSKIKLKNQIEAVMVHFNIILPFL